MPIRLPPIDGFYSCRVARRVFRSGRLPRRASSGNIDHTLKLFDSFCSKSCVTLCPVFFHCSLLEVLHLSSQALIGIAGLFRKTKAQHNPCTQQAAFTAGNNVAGSWQKKSSKNRQTKETRLHGLCADCPGNYNCSGFFFT